MCRKVKRAQRSSRTGVFLSHSIRRYRVRSVSLRGEVGGSRSSWGSCKVQEETDRRGVATGVGVAFEVVCRKPAPEQDRGVIDRWRRGMQKHEGAQREVNGAILRGRVADVEEYNTSIRGKRYAVLYA